MPNDSTQEKYQPDAIRSAARTPRCCSNTSRLYSTALSCTAGQPLPKLEVSAVRGLKGIKEATITFPDTAPQGVAGRELRVAVASGIGFARQLLDRMDKGEAQYDFVEVRTWLA